MLYRIDRIDTNGCVDYEYVFSKRTLGKSCFEICRDTDLEILDIYKLCFSWKAFRICAKHTISKTKNKTT